MPTASLSAPPGKALEDDVPEIAVGDVLEGRWEILRKLGEGGMGTVVLAKEKQLDRLVAVKVLARHLCKDPGAVARFEREGRFTAQLEHPHIVPVHAVGHFHDRPFIVMKYLEGASLWEQLRRRPAPWPWEDVRAVVRPLCQALGFLHSRDLIHRDVKPGNVFVGPDGHVTLLDFGILKETTTDATTTGVAQGTFRWMAPEQVVPGSPVDRRADLYAVGVLLYQMLAGRTPFEGAETDVAQAKLRGEPPSARRFNPELSEPISEVLDRCLRRKPEERFDTAQELLDALDAAHAGRRPGRPRSGRRAWTRAIAIALPAAAALVLGVRQIRSAKPPPEPTPTPAPAPPPAVAPPAPAETPAPAPPVAAPPVIPPAHAVSAVVRPRTRPHAPPAAPSQPVKVSLVSRIDGKSGYAELFVDGKSAGETPTMIELAPGPHHLRLVRDGYRPLEQKLDLRAGHDQRLMLDLRKE